MCCSYLRQSLQAEIASSLLEKSTIEKQTNKPLIKLSDTEYFPQVSY